MPTNRRYRQRRLLAVTIPEIEIAFLAEDDEGYEAAKASADRDERGAVGMWFLTGIDAKQAERWQFCRAAVAARCASLRPGWRSSWWWRFEGHDPAPVDRAAFLKRHGLLLSGEA